MTEARVQAIEAALRDALQPVAMLVKDQSHLHAGHAGAQDGRGHFEVTIISDQFAGQSRIQRHRTIFDAVGDMMKTDIHALSINAFTPEERSEI